MSFRGIRNRWPGIWTLLAAIVLGTWAAVAQNANPPEAPAPPAPPAAVAPPAEPGAPAMAAEEHRADQPAEAAEAAPTKVRIDQVVAVGSSATVRPNQKADEVVVVRGDATIEGEVDGDVVVIFGKAKVTGRVDGDLVVVLGEAEVNGTVTGDLALVGTRSHFRSKADVRGDIVAVGVAPEIDPGAKIKGTPEVVSLGPLMTYFDWAKDYLFQGVFLLRPFPPRLGWVWVIAGIFLAFHLLLAMLFPGALRGCMDTLREQPARSFLIGLLACILVGPLSLLLSFTVVATPLLWLVFLALCVFGRVAAYGAAGSALGRASGSAALVHPVPAVLAGSLLFYVAYMVPVLGYLVYWLVLPWGVGAALIRLSDALRRERRPAAPALSNGSGTGGGGGGGGGTLAAATALASGSTGPATQALVTEAPTGSGATPAGTVFPDQESARPIEPPITPLPAPEPGASPGRPPVMGLSPVELAALPRVGFWPRFGATAIDILVVAFVTVLLSGHARMFWLLLGLYHLAFWGWRATTLGGSILGLRVIRVDGRPLDWPTAVVRVLGGVVSLLPLGVGFFWASWDDQCQSWHDRIAGTTIVRSDRRVSLV